MKGFALVVLLGLSALAYSPPVAAHTGKVQHELVYTAMDLPVREVLVYVPTAMVDACIIDEPVGVACVSGELVCGAQKVEYGTVGHTIRRSNPGKYIGKHDPALHIDPGLKIC